MWSCLEPLFAQRLLELMYWGLASVRYLNYVDAFDEIEIVGFSEIFNSVSGVADI